ncbi:MAG: hypothetical protein U0470_14350 [Anaerolineae bacterium]
MKQPVVRQLDDDVLAASPDGDDGLAADALVQLGGRVARRLARPAEARTGEAPARQGAGEVAGVRLDFGQLGHRPIVAAGRANRMGRGG